MLKVDDSKYWSKLIKPASGCASARLRSGVRSAQAQGASGEEPPVKAAVRDARWWTSLSGDAKNTFLDGYTDAMSRVSNRLFTECADKMKKMEMW